MLYVPHSEQAPYDVARALGLLPIDEAADVIVLRAHDRVVFERPGMADSIPRVALSQLALDCLSGPGRMPAEGEAILAHMADHEDLWRSSDLSSLEADPLT